MRPSWLASIPTMAMAVCFACTGDEPVGPVTSPDAGQADSGIDAHEPGPVDGGGTDTDTAPVSPPVDAGPCNASADFGKPSVLTTLSSIDPEQQPTLTVDELTIYFVRKGKVFSASRPTRDADFATPAEVTSANTDTTKYWQGAGLTRDGQTLILGTKQLFVSRRTNGSFGAPEPVLGDGSSSISGEHAYLSGDQSAVYFNTVPDVPPVIQRATLISGTAWTNVQKITEFGTGHSDRYPVVTPDELTMYFASKRGGTSEDIYISKRTKTTDPWDEPAPLPGAVNSDGNEAPSWLSADGCRLYLVMSAKGSINTDVYVATKPH